MFSGEAHSNNSGGTDRDEWELQYICPNLSVFTDSKELAKNGLYLVHIITCAVNTPTLYMFCKELGLPTPHTHPYITSVNCNCYGSALQTASRLNKVCISIFHRMKLMGLLRWLNLSNVKTLPEPRAKIYINESFDCEEFNLLLCRHGNPSAQPQSSFSRQRRIHILFHLGHKTAPSFRSDA